MKKNEKIVDVKVKDNIMTITTRIETTYCFAVDIEDNKLISDYLPPEDEFELPEYLIPVGEFELPEY